MLSLSQCCGRTAYRLSDQLLPSSSVMGKYALTNRPKRKIAQAHAVVDARPWTDEHPASIKTPYFGFAEDPSLLQNPRFLRANERRTSGSVIQSSDASRRTNGPSGSNLLRGTFEVASARSKPGGNDRTWHPIEIQVSKAGRGWRAIEI
jgi:hypothetical protein